MDTLDIALNNIWKNYITRAEDVVLGGDYFYLISEREDAKAAFKRQVREAIEAAGYRKELRTDISQQRRMI